MTTDVDVQFFSHLNNLTLSNNFGDLIRLLDKCLVNGLPLTSIVAASISGQGDIHLTTYAEHKCLLFQIIELSNFAPVNLNGKYRIKGIPSTTELILKAEHTGGSITTTGVAKLASLGYEIAFRDDNDVKRVYRAKNPTSKHPFIRIDESLSSADGATGVYPASYAKYAMVGLLSDMTHIDDVDRPEAMQLPAGTPAEKWGVSGVDANCKRGSYRWYWAHDKDAFTGTQYSDSTAPAAGNRQFLICGDKNAFYFQRTFKSFGNTSQITGLGLINSLYSEDGLNEWFIHCSRIPSAASTTYNPYNMSGSYPFLYSENTSSGYMFTDSKVNSSHSAAYPIVPNYSSGNSDIYSGTAFSALEIPIVDAQKKLRGTFKHINYVGRVLSSSGYYLNGIASLVESNSMYVVYGNSGTLAFYLGELE